LPSSAALFSAFAYHLLHPFPLFRRNYVHALWHENVIRRNAARKNVIAWPNVRNRDAVATTAQ
jgi:hypothetical protein